ncbi:peptidase M14 [Bordetella genomosp. 8]|uniref:Peptidase M14 n=1 Tax=Bordetella genomosp. 8 TaxID=1416806 RepID=A0A1W6YRG3_9BORD|nr:peptidase M14 [Bordetella genomosp. 8]ARP83685.1 peptidase M14 [Bordetella genomosp. 8]
MTVLLDRVIDRTLDDWVREFSAEEYRGARVQAWLFEDETARRAAERRLAAAGVTAVFRSAYKPLVHFFLEEVDRDGLESVAVRYPVRQEAVQRRFTLEAYPLAGMLGDADLEFVAGDADLHYEVTLTYADGRTETARVFAPNRVAEDHAGVVNLSPTGWVRVEGRTDGVEIDEARATEFAQVFDEIVGAVRAHAWGDKEPYFERLDIRVDIPAIERDLHYHDDVISTVEALHEDLYFGLLEIFQRHSGRPLGNRGLQPGQIVPDVRRVDGPARVRVELKPFPAVVATTPDGTGTPLDQVDGALSFGRIAHEMALIGGEPYTARTRQGRPVLCTYVKGANKPVVISGGQHANETSGVVGALRAAQVLKDQPGAHFVLFASENPDGYALHRELCQHNPRHMSHAARYSALGDDLAYRERAPWYEREARRKAYEISRAELHINLHGYPAHEWTRPLSGYLPRSFELWTVPKGFFLVMRHHPGWLDEANTLLSHVTARLAERVPGLVEYNARQLRMFETHALQRNVDVMHGIPVQRTEGVGEDVPLVLISEFPDETVYGDAFRFAHAVQTETVLAGVEGYLAMTAADA